MRDASEPRRRIFRTPRRNWRNGFFRTDDSGFTIIEVVVASTVMLSALVLISGVMTAGLTSAGIGRQRNTANSLANQSLERVRALPFETLSRGLDTTDVANTAGTTDDNITLSGASCTGPGTTYCFDGERIVHGTNAATDPLVPHMKAVPSGPNVFNVSTYVTFVDNAISPPDAFRVTVHVDWDSKIGQKQQSVEAQTVIYSAAACLDLAVHPYSGPCQPAFSAAATSESGTIQINGSVGDIVLDHATLRTGRATSDTNIEQITLVKGHAQSAGANIQAASQAEQAIGAQSEDSRADNDPDVTNPLYDSQPLSAQGAITAPLTSGANGITVGLTAGGSGRTTSATSATTATTDVCPRLTGVTNDNDSQACGGSESTTASTVTASADLAALASIPLASVGPQVAPNQAITNRNLTTGDGNVSASMSRAAIDYKVGGLPASVLGGLIGFDYFVKLEGYRDHASAAAGVGSAAPQAAVDGGTLKFWTGGLLTPYTSVNVSAITPSNVPTIPPLSASLPGGVQVNMAATITPPTTSVVSEPTSCAGSCTRTAGSATVTPLKIAVDVTVTVGGVSVDLDFIIDPGTIQTQSTYVSSPTS